MNEPNKKKQPLSVFPITFQLYAHNEQEIEDARTAIVAFIEQHRLCGRAVTAPKVAQAITRWEQNPIVKSQIIKYFT